MIRAVTLAVVLLSCGACTVPATGNAQTSAVEPSAVASSAVGTSRAERATAPTVGRLVDETIPGATSHFPARPATVYLPPAAIRDPHRRLPVLILLHGTGRGPSAWESHGQLGRILAAFASSHGGAAPVVVMPDINGSPHVDSECVHTQTGDIEDYLSHDVPDYIAAHLPATTDHSRWMIAGLSEGATCASMLALRHPTVFPTFGDVAGLTRATVGEVDEPARTVRELFGGSNSAFQQHDPTWLLTHHRYPSMAGWFTCGIRDPTLRAQNALIRASRAAGLTVASSTTPYRHSWAEWTQTAARMLAWFWRRAHD